MHGTPVRVGVCMSACAGVRGGAFVKGRKKKKRECVGRCTRRISSWLNPNVRFPVFKTCCTAVLVALRFRRCSGQSDWSWNGERKEEKVLKGTARSHSQSLRILPQQEREACWHDSACFTEQYSFVNATRKKVYSRQQGGEEKERLSSAFTGGLRCDDVIRSAHVSRTREPHATALRGY